MQVKYNMVVDFARPSKSNTIAVAEDDSGTRVCLFTLLANKKPMDMSDVSTAIVKAVKASGKVVYGDATIVTDEDGVKTNQITYTIPREMSNESGLVTITISLNSSEGDSITSFEFYLSVRNQLYSEDDYVDDDSLLGFRDIMNRTSAALQKMELMTKQDALPNPYPINVIVDGKYIGYNGSETVAVELGDIVRYKKLS